MKKEIWKDIPGYEGLYQASTEGRIKSVNFNRSGVEKVLSRRSDSSGYYQVILYKENKYKSYKSHRLIGSCFIPNPDNKPQINHKNGIKTDNRVENLEWCTNLENAQHSWRELGRKNVEGEDHHKSKLKIADVKFIRENLHISSREIARQYGLNKSSVLSIRKYKSWKSI